jgi:acyl transferase domain-containing protein/acyl carrier protein
MMDNTNGTARSTGAAATPLTRALDTIKRLRAQLDAQSGRQSIAVVGVGLRLPGGIDDLDSYWAALAARRDLVRQMPDARKEPFRTQWDALPHKGGFLDDVLGFDAAFFGISPREARGLDPQHRLLLEVSWEALEDAAVPPDRMGDTRAGLYLGVTGQDYRDWQRGKPDAYWATGNGHCFAAGRIAYALGLVGPAIAVDTACSSSLVAIHLASQALRREECDVALAGGVNLILSPRSTELVVETRSLAPDGLCKAFDARANGFTRGEGCGVVVLKRLDHAVRDGDRIHAVIHGSAINQDGRSTGFTAPNVLSQVALIEAALADAQLTPADIGMVEAHGTGTSLGDPIEMEAISAALGRRNGATPLYVGSVKTNIGHLEAAAGIAGFVKAILCLTHRAVPPLVHFDTLNPRIDLEGTEIRLPTALQQWVPDAAGRCAGVSSFGMSGTNAHIIVGPPDPTAATGSAAATGPGAAVTGPGSGVADTGSGAAVTGFEVSAKTPQALCELSARLRDRLAGLADEDYPAFAYTLTHGRARHAVRAWVAAPDRQAAAAALAALADGGDPAPERPEAGEPLPRRVLPLPHYPWQRQRYAPEPDEPPGPAAPTRPVEPGEPVVAPVPRYELDWRPAPDPTGAIAGTVVLAGDDAASIAALEPGARRRGLTAVVVEAVDDPAWWATFWATRPAGESATLILTPRGNPLPDEPGPGAPVAGRGAALCAAVVAAVRAAPDSVQVYAVTRAARQVTGDDPVAATDHGLLHGLSPVLGLEFPAVWGGLVDLPAVPSQADGAAALGLLGVPDEDVLAVRGGIGYVARLRPVTGPPPDLPVRADATYLVTGGLGGIGRAIVADLVRRGARHLLLLGRRAEAQLDADARAALAGWRDDGVAVRYRSADLDDGDALAAACATDGPPVRGVIHAAGTIAQVPLAGADAATFDTALRGKYTGGWWLHLCSRAWELDFFVALSSVSALWGTEGYGAYAAANGGLDAIAAYRAAAGAAAVAIAYGPWAVDGMAGTGAREHLARMGVGAIEPPAGCASLTAASAGRQGVVAACPVDWSRFVEVMASRRPRALFAELAGVPATPAATGADPDAAAANAAPESQPALDALLALPERARVDAARAHVLRRLARILGHREAADIREDMGFFDLGLDSIMAVDLARELSDDYGLDLRIGDLFDHPTVTGLASLVLDRIAAATATATPADAATPAPAPRPAARPPVPPTPPAPGRRAVPPLGQPGAAAPEPIAIVGMSARFPGADSVEEFWDLLRDGRDAVGPVPPERFDIAELHDADPTRTGTITSDQGGFLSDVARFDASFFDIPAREAESLDPQQRLLLEGAWHALEDAAIDPRSLRGSRTGVFVGITNSDYARLLEQGGLDQLDAYFGTGTSLNAAAGRVAFALGLHGPAIALDTACSSSLVAVHLAIRSLRSGETDQALAGGVNVIAAPSCSVAVSRAHMLSPDGRCKTFAADADGFVRAEGCGVLVLKRLRDALRDGDRLLGVLHGSAVNSDGASSGLTVPSGRAQEAVITAALADAGLPGSAVSYLEAHGTGTSLGDPIELDAAWKALGPGRRPGEPLHIGSVKSNIGHCESASGMAGIIKTVLALNHGELPASLHCETLNPHVPWPDLNVRVVDRLTPWRTGDRARQAGVSGFGFSGTNAHVIVGAAPELAATEAPPAGEPVLLPLSAPDQAGFERLVDAWRDHLAVLPDEAVAATVHTAGNGRAHFPVRRAVLGRTGRDLAAALDAATVPAPKHRAPRVAFLFSGQGSQYFGMGRELYETEQVFRGVIDSCDRVLAPHLGASLPDLMFYGEDRKLINQTRVTQPALVALELGLAALWESWGVSATAVIGHSVGEIAAAIHAGVMDLDAGLTLIAHRARLMQDTEHGGMLSIAAPLARVTEWLAGTALDVAVVNAPESIVVAGAPAELEAFAARMKVLGVTTRALVVSHAFHSRLMEPILGELEAAIAGFEFRAPKIPIIANVTGEPARPDEYCPGYWARHVRQPVRFDAGAQALRALDVDVLLEIGPDRTLVNLVAAAGLTPDGGGVPSLRRGGKARTILLQAASALYEQGQPLVWRNIQGGGRSAAPRYPFAPTRHWTKVRPRVAQPARATRHWGGELRSPALRGRVFAFERTAEFPAYLTDHRLYGTVVTPAASHLGTILSALGRDGAPLVLEDLVFPRALVVMDGERYDAQILVGVDGDPRTVHVRSLLDPDRNQWEEHLSGRIGSAPNLTRRTPDRDRFQATAERHLTGEEFYRYFHDLGYTLGPSFRWIAEVWIRGDEALLRYGRPPLPDAEADYEVYPGLIDSCFQSIAGFLVDGTAEAAPSLAIPFSTTRLSFVERPAAGDELWGHVQILHADPLPNGRLRVETADLHMFTAAGASVMVADGFRVRHAPRAVLKHSLRGGPPNAYELTWAPAPASPAAAARTILLLGERPGLAQALTAAGHTVHVNALVDSVDLVVDAHYADVAAAGADDALRAALDVYGLLRMVPAEVPYVVLLDDRDAAAPVREAVAGMLTALEAEESQRRIIRISAEPTADVGRVAALLSRRLTETRYRLDGTATQVARLARVDTAAGSPHWTGGVLITGGLGALGLSVAQTVATQGARSITLMGRSAPDAAARRVIEELTAAGVEVRVANGDVTDPDDCARAVATAAGDGGLRGVFHLAGVTDDRAFAHLTPASIEKVFDAKARGAQAIATAAKDQPLDAFVLFSSVSSVLGSAGQVNYAAANGYLAGLAALLRAQGVPATAVHWGPWVPEAKGGMAAGAAVIRAAERMGLQPLSDADAAPLLALAVTTPQIRLVGVAMDPARYAQAVGDHPRTALVSALATGPRREAAAAPARPKGWLRGELEALDAQTRDDTLRAAIRQLVGQALGDPDKVEDQVGFAELGLDSIMVIDLRTQLAHGLDTDVPATAAIDYPNVAAMTRFVTGLVFPEPEAPEPPPPAQFAAEAPQVDPEELSLEQLLAAVRDDLAMER